MVSFPNKMKDRYGVFYLARAFITLLALGKSVSVVVDRRYVALHHKADMKFQDSH
jgi:hypothetical protein